MRLIPLVLTVLISVLPADSAAREKSGRTSEATTLEIIDQTPVGLLQSTSSLQQLANRETAGPDTFALYGGPDHPTEGKFQMVDGISPDWGGANGLPGGVYGGGPDAWIPVDITDHPVYWHVSTFNAENLNGNGAGNNAMWSGIADGDLRAESWVHTQGYGNSWADGLIYESGPVTDTSIGETVSLDFFFNHDLEPGYDFLIVQYDSAGTWTRIFRQDGSNADSLGTFNPPGVQYSTVGANPIVYAGNDYGGLGADQIRIRVLISSDVAWSDEDGLWPTQAGAAQIDDISLTHSLGTFTEDFEGTSPFLFRPDKSPFAGDFAEVYPRLTDIDPCRDNLTPVVGFIDFNQIVRNGPAPDGTVQTGGSTNASVNYGIPGSWVVNSFGGISFGSREVSNQIWSPAILWDLPGVDDDDVDISGAFLRFTVWADLPLSTGVFYVWHVRSARPGEPFRPWTDRSFVYYGGGVPGWYNVRQDVSDLLQSGPERVQIALGVLDLGDIFGWPAVPAKPSPCFDNVALYKYRVGGPTIATRIIDTAQDGFPVSGSIDVSTQVSRDALDIPFSMARDVNTGALVNVPGDSVIVDVKAAIPGTILVDIRMVWALNTNAVFEDAIRSAPARAEDQNVVAGVAGTVWTGEVVATEATTVAGGLVADRYFADLPDADFIYPGDVLHYYFQAIDSDGRTTTLPADTSGFGVFGPGASYDRAFTVRGLPTITDTSGEQPEMLVINDFGRRGGEDEFITAFRQIGAGEGVHFDTYTVQGPSSLVSNGIGSSGDHGAEPGQLGAYQYIFYFAGNLSTGLLSNGTNTGDNDKSNDIGVLEQWHALDPGVNGHRSVAYFGDYIATSLREDSAEGLAYLNNIMGVDWIDRDVRDVIGGQTAPVVVPSELYGDFRTEFVAYGGCLLVNEFDQIQPSVGSGAGHYFTDTSGIPITDVNAGVASVVHPTTYGVDVTYPYSMIYVWDVVGRTVSPSARASLFEETRYLMGADPVYCDPFPCCPFPPCTAAPAARQTSLSVRPNPFNPVTTVEFTAAIGSKGSVKVYNLRGELVRTLHSGEFQTQSFSWDGTDNRGSSVASGVYLIKAEAGGEAMTRKIALVK